MSQHAHTDTSLRAIARCGIVPPYLLAHIARTEVPHLAVAAESARNSLLHDEPFRGIRDPKQPGVSWSEALWPSAERPREARPGLRASVQAGGAPGQPRRMISDAAGAERLPGVRVRGEGGSPITDVAANEAYDGLGHTYELFWAVYGRDSIDGAGLPLDSTVHFGQRYDNAFWDGARMVFGDGDGQIFNRFTISLSVIGHELCHGVIQHSAALNYSGQSGSLNESVSDVFGALVEQFALGQTAAEASWLIGDGLFTPRVEGRALRSMSAPGTAYDDDVLGRDPQPAHMTGYIETNDDNGGVHLNSGIPNRAFSLAATAIGGNAWERAGQIWYDTLTAGSLSPDASFTDFAAATVAASRARFGERAPESAAVRSGWDGVGVSWRG